MEIFQGSRYVCEFVSLFVCVVLGWWARQGRGENSR